MKRKIVSLVAAFKNVDAFGIKYAADFAPLSLGGQQFALVHAAVLTTGNLGAAQVSGKEDAHSAVLGKVACRFHLHDDMISIVNAAHSLALLGTTALDGKFLMPRATRSDQVLLNTARAFAADAVAFQTQLVSTGLAPDFITHLNADITAFEAVITAKGAGKGTQAGATGGLDDTAHQAAVALHVLDTLVKNTYKHNPQRLAEWAVARHVEKSPVHAQPPAPAAAPAHP